MMFPRSIPVPVKAKLVDEEAVQKLQRRVEELKQSYRPEQGWLTSRENQVRRVR